jgi:hypothetical protein
MHFKNIVPFQKSMDEDFFVPAHSDKSKGGSESSIITFLSFIYWNTKWAYISELQTEICREKYKNYPLKLHTTETARCPLLLANIFDISRPWILNFWIFETDF